MDAEVEDAPSIIEDDTCSACGKFIPEDDQADHEAGRDVKRPHCPHQDLEKFEGGAQRWVPGLVMPDVW